MENRAEQRRRAVLEALARATEPLIAARAKASYEANVGRPKKSCQKSDKISRVDTKREAAKVALNHGSTPTPARPGTPQHGGQDQRTTDVATHGRGQVGDRAL